MNLAIVLAGALIASEVNQVPDVPDVPEVLSGIDTLPGERARAATSTERLLATLLDVNLALRFRARAARLLEDVGLDRDDVERGLQQTASSSVTPPVLRAQSMLALARRAHARHEETVASAITERALGDHDETVARAGVFLTWWLDGPTADHRLKALAARVESVGAAARGRLRAGPVSRRRPPVDGDEARPGARAGRGEDAGVVSPRSVVP